MNLSAREIEVLQLSADGLSIEYICDHLHLSKRTVNTLRQVVYQKLGADNLPHAIAQAFRAGILT